MIDNTIAGDLLYSRNPLSVLRPFVLHLLWTYSSFNGSRQGREMIYIVSTMYVNIVAVHALRYNCYWKLLTRTQAYHFPKIHFIVKLLARLK